MLALLFKSRIKRLKRMQPEEHQGPRRVSNDEFFNAPLGSLMNPNQFRVKRVLVKPN